MNEPEINYMPTKEAKKLLKVSGCQIMHLRDSGKIQFKRKGNGYWYLREDVQKIAQDKMVVE